MPAWMHFDLQHLFVPSQPIAETVVRGTCMYLAVFALLRIFRRQTGSIGPADLLVLLLIADAAQNGMAGEYKSITDGLILVCTIIGWEYILDWVGFRSLGVRQFLERSPLLLIRNGQILEQHLKSELITVDDLLAHLRRKGIESPRQVKRCFLEGDGHVSVLSFEASAAQLRDEEDEQK